MLSKSLIVSGAGSICHLRDKPLKGHLATGVLCSLLPLQFAYSIMSSTAMLTRISAAVGGYE